MLGQYENGPKVDKATSWNGPFIFVSVKHRSFRRVEAGRLGFNASAPPSLHPQSHQRTVVFRLKLWTNSSRISLSPAIFLLPSHFLQQQSFFFSQRLLTFSSDNSTTLSLLSMPSHFLQRQQHSLFTQVCGKPVHHPLADKWIHNIGTCHKNSFIWKILHQFLSGGLENGLCGFRIFILWLQLFIHPLDGT
ncbi:PREDICTED: uncharacterized protein LOC104604106 [Nelumbo nucifera]|uniref:Uncharacterized protein LOC104604106 n=1 Tax=Nelumbo nucifera TaxID=4432 RepID=A0A1U8AUN7_NELNU|nr:PREDICTED: uncharacterized protein LOC104604106 [Nelumbo nucifera]